MSDMKIKIENINEDLLEEIDAYGFMMYMKGANKHDMIRFSEFLGQTNEEED
jgi:hypothetical protein